MTTADPIFDFNTTVVTKIQEKKMSEKIKKLTPYSHVRLRTTVYYGSTALQTQPVLNFVDGKMVLEETSWVPAVFTSYREIIDNALDEVVAHGYGTRIDVIYDPATRIFSIEDNGRGIPIDWDEDHKMHKATLALSEIMSGRNFEDRADTAGMNGIGASGVNFCSEFFNVEIHRDNKRFYQEFRENDEALFSAGLQILTPKITRKTSPSGTKITFKLSNYVYKDMTLPENFLKSRVIEVATVNPHVRFSYNGEHIKVKPRVEQTLFNDIRNILIEVKDPEKKFRSRFWLVPNFVESGDHTHSIVNNIPAFNGGVHIDAFKRQFFSGLLNALERESRKRKLTPNRSDLIEGVLIYNITSMNKPDFDSQSKTRLITEEASTIVKKFLETEDFYKDIIRKNKEWIDEIYARCAERTQKKDAGEVAKLARKVLRNKVPGLMDANGTKRQQCTLFLAEGESAISGMGSVRDPDLHGGLGLRGKILNVNGEHPKKILDNKCLVEIMNSVGLVIGEQANRFQLRYGKVYIATDMDEDGKNIAALLVNFFHSYWPELFDEKQEPFVYVFQTPFVIAEKGKQRKYWYAHDYSDFKPEDWSGWSITRAKGLGTLTEEDWIYSLKNPIALPLIDSGKMKEALDLIFNSKNADLRKAWIGL